MTNTLTKITGSYLENGQPHASREGVLFFEDLDRARIFSEMWLAKVAFERSTVAQAGALPVAIYDRSGIDFDTVSAVVLKEHGLDLRITDKALDPHPDNSLLILASEADVTNFHELTRKLGSVASLFSETSPAHTHIDIVCNPLPVVFSHHELRSVLGQYNIEEFDVRLAMTGILSSRLGISQDKITPHSKSIEYYERHAREGFKPLDQTEFHELVHNAVERVLE